MAKVIINSKWASVIFLRILCLFLYNLILRFKNMGCWYITANRGCRINIHIRSKHCTRIQNTVASYLYTVSQHCTEFLETSLNIAFTGMNNHQLLI